MARRDEAGELATSWLGAMVDGSRPFRWTAQGPATVVAEPHSDLPCTVFASARGFAGCWVATLFLMAGRRATTCYWQWATSGARQAPPARRRGDRRRRMGHRHAAADRSKLDQEPCRVICSSPSATTGPVWANRAVFQEEHVPRLIETDHGRVALMSDGKLIEIFDDTASATHAGYEQFGVGGFSTHPIGHPPWRIASLIGGQRTKG